MNERTQKKCMDGWTEGWARWDEMRIEWMDEINKQKGKRNKEWQRETNKGFYRKIMEHDKLRGPSSAVGDDLLRCFASLVKLYPWRYSIRETIQHFTILSHFMHV